jgi:hypothetical protein
MVSFSAVAAALSSDDAVSPDFSSIDVKGTDQQ